MLVDGELLNREEGAFFEGRSQLEMKGSHRTFGTWTMDSATTQPATLD